MSTLEGRIKANVVVAYANVLAVDLIYFDRVRGRMMFWVFTSNKEYDDALMDRLIERELRVHDMFPGTLVSITYPPLVLVGDPRNYVPHTAQLIYGNRMKNASPEY